MKGLLISGTIIIMAVTVVLAQERTPLEFPLGLTPGISNDSTIVLLTSRSATLESGRENNYAIDFSFADTPIKTIIPVFLKSRLLSVSLYSSPTGDREVHVARIKKAFRFIKDNYDCRVVDEIISSGSFLSGLGDGIELASFSSDDFSLFLSSEFESEKGYLLNIHIYSLPLIIPSSEK